MPSTQVVSAVAKGSARSMDLHNLIAGSVQTAQERGSGTSTPGSNLFISNTGAYGGVGTGNPSQNNWGAMQCNQLPQGACMINAVIPWVLHRPQNRFTWPIGRYVFDTCIAWNVNTVTGVEYGIVVGTGDFVSPYSGADLGFGVTNDAGTVKFFNRSPNGFETINLNIPSPQEWNKFTFQFSQARIDQEAIFVFYVNDLPVVTRTNADLGYTDANQIFWFLPCLGNKGAPGNVVLFAQPGFWAGPDTDIGMM